MTKQKPSKLEIVQRSKYSNLHQHFIELKEIEWSTTFYEIEKILGFSLPNSASIRPWWSSGSHSKSWKLAGWKVGSVDLKSETVTFIRVDADGKYWRLKKFLSELEVAEWGTTFSEIETLLGFKLPNSSKYRAWFANSAHSQSLSWETAGWETSSVDMDAKTLTFRKTAATIKKQKLIENGKLKSQQKPVHKKSSKPQRSNGNAAITIQRICADTRNIPIEVGAADVIITSPPYWNLRDYNVEGQIGQEATPEGYIINLIDCMREWKRILPVTGSVFINIGDTYHNRSLVGIPAMLEIAAKKDGWILRNKIAWVKSQGMPDPAKTRLKSRHETIFHFTKIRTGYYYDQFGYSVKYGNGTTPSDVWNIGFQRSSSPHLAPFPEELVDRCLSLGCPYQVCVECNKPRMRLVERTTELDLSRPAARRAKKLAEEAGLTQEHIVAVQSLGISDAGKAMQTQAVSNTEEVIKLAAEAKSVLRGLTREFTFPLRKSVGWTACDCGGPFRRGIVLDPFVGSGTTLRAAAAAERSAIGVDLDISHCVDI